MMNVPMPLILSRILFLFCLLTPLQTVAQSTGKRISDLPGATNTASTQAEILYPDEAFKLSVVVTSPNSLAAYWKISDGYYLYRDKFKFEVVEKNVGIDQSAIVLPNGKIKEDPSFGKVEIYTGNVSIDLPIIRENAAETAITLKVSYQGCKDKSVCYPPIRKNIPLTLAAFSGPAAAAGGMDISSVNNKELSAQDAITEGLKSGGLLFNILGML